MGIISIFIMLAGFGSLVVVVWRGFSRLSENVKKSMEMTKKQEERLRKREAFVISAIIDRELEENIGKLEAFLIVYSDMLKNFEKDRNSISRHLQTGELIHKSPSLKRSAFDNNVGKLDLLDKQLAKDIMKLYENIWEEPEYIRISPDAPKEEIEAKIRNIIEKSRSMIPPIDLVRESLAKNL